MEEMKRVEKPWGYEEILDDKGVYLVKKLVLRDETSLHYHNVRNELLIPVSGSGMLILKNHTFPLIPYIPFYVGKGVIHKIVPDRFLEIIEISDGKENDVIRISNKHKRIRENAR